MHGHLRRPQGKRVTLTVVYLSRALQWEAQLPDHIRQQVERVMCQHAHSLIVAPHRNVTAVPVPGPAAGRPQGSLCAHEGRPFCILSQLSHD